jgi:hypothetical protein
MSIEEIVRQRGITEILHFTTNRGLLGVLHSRFLKSKERLQTDQQLEFIFHANAPFRKDLEWLDYVNLSVSRINSRFLDISKNRWHRDRDIWWCVLSFAPMMLSHSGVYFTTTNNMYTGVRRAQGPEGLEGMFAGTIVQWHSSSVVRAPKSPAAYPTCMQAEVLYPGELSTSFLQKVYVACDEDSDEVYGQFAALGLDQVTIIVSPEVFRLT